MIAHMIANIIRDSIMVGCDILNRKEIIIVTLSAFDTLKTLFCAHVRGKNVGSVQTCVRIPIAYFMCFFFGFM